MASLDGRYVTHLSLVLLYNRPKLHYPVSLLKSILQKNVRLGRAWPAVRAAFALMKESVPQFVRRLGVLCLEDTILHPALPLVVWLTAAVSNVHSPFRLTARHVDLLLAIVYELASVRVRDPIATDRVPPPSFADVASVLRPGDEHSLIRSLLARASYGGTTTSEAKLSCCLGSYSPERWHYRNEVRRADDA